MQVNANEFSGLVLMHDSPKLLALAPVVHSQVFTTHRKGCAGAAARQ